MIKKCNSFQYNKHCSIYTCNICHTLIKIVQNGSSLFPLFLMDNLHDIPVTSYYNFKSTNQIFIPQKLMDQVNQIVKQ